mgnify:CR=1 FL=1
MAPPSATASARCSVLTIGAEACLHEPTWRCVNAGGIAYGLLGALIDFAHQGRRTIYRSPSAAPRKSHEARARYRPRTKGRRGRAGVLAPLVSSRGYNQPLPMQLFEWPALAWLALAICRRRSSKISVPHFGLVFVGVAALAAARHRARCRPAPRLQIVTFALRARRVVRGAAALARRARASGRGIPSRTQQLIGREGVVTNDIDPTTGTGRVNVGGEDWARRSSGDRGDRHARDE